MTNDIKSPNNVKTPDIIVETSHLFNRIILSGIYGHLSPLGMEATVYTDLDFPNEAFETQSIDSNKMKTKRIIQCDLIVSPLQMVELRDWLNQRIEDYTQVFGEIPKLSDVDKRLIDLLNKSKSTKDLAHVP